MADDATAAPHPTRATTGDGASYSQFVAGAGPYLHVNRLVDVLELHAVLKAGDGERFDRHFDNMLRQSRDPSFGAEPRMLTRLELDEGSRPSYRPSPARRLPRTFEVLTCVARALPRDRFVEYLMGPSALQVPFGVRPGVVIDPSLPLAELADEMARDHMVHLGPLFDRALMEELAAQVEAAPFEAMRHSSLGVDYTMDFPPTQAVLHAIVTDARIVGLVERIAGIDSGLLHHFSGRVYRMVPRRDADSYHNDVHRTDKRLVAVTVCLTSTPPVGGRVLLRRKGFLRPLGTSRPAALGEVVMFRISRKLEHRVESVRAHTRTNLAGWFCAAPQYPYDRWVDRELFPPTPWWRRLWARR